MKYLSTWAPPGSSLLRWTPSSGTVTALSRGPCHRHTHTHACTHTLLKGRERISRAVFFLKKKKAICVSRESLTSQQWWRVMTSWYIFSTKGLTQYNGEKKRLFFRKWADYICTKSSQLVSQEFFFFFFPFPSVPVWTLCVCVCQATKQDDGKKQSRMDRAEGAGGGGGFQGSPADWEPMTWMVEKPPLPSCTTTPELAKLCWSSTFPLWTDKKLAQNYCCSKNNHLPNLSCWWERSKKALIWALSFL